MYSNLLVGVLPVGAGVETATSLITGFLLFILSTTRDVIDLHMSHYVMLN